MKLHAVLILSPLFASCTIHLHVHEAPDPAAIATHDNSQDQGMARGVVRDSQGAGVEAHVALVGMAGGGSNTMGTGADGRFAIPEIGTSNFTLHASTADGRVAIASSHPGRGEVELVLAPGAVFVITLEGREKARCAVFADGLRIEDFMLRAGVPERVVVPPGEQRVRIYEGDQVLHERQIAAKAGRTEEVRMLPQG